MGEPMLSAVPTSTYPDLHPFSKVEGGDIFTHNGQRYQKLADSTLNRGTGFNAVNLDTAVPYFLAENTVVQTGFTIGLDSVQEAELKVRIALQTLDAKFGDLQFGDIFTVPTLLRELGTRRVIPGTFIRLRSSGQDSPNALHIESATITYINETSRAVRIDHLDILADKGIYYRVRSEPYYPEMYDMFKDELEGIEVQEEAPKEVSPVNSIHSQLEEISILAKASQNRVSPFAAAFFMVLGFVLGKFF